jgi:alpha-beta hydrolase superfamily lysophospholipase
VSDGQVENAAAVRPEPARAWPLWFGARGRELFGLYHEPAAPACDLAILLCNPFGYEAMVTHRSYLRLANELQRRGFAVLRFDYHGCGNSSGDDRDPDRMQAWHDSIHTALDELKALSGCAEIGVFGLRFGANLALTVAATRADVRALALWGPFATGRTFLREEQTVHKLRPLDPKFDRPETRAPGEIETLGFAISAQTVAAIEAHNVAGLIELKPRKALVLTRDTPLQEQRVADRLSELGAEVTFGTGGGYQLMMNDFMPPAETWDQVVHYFERMRTPALERNAAPLERSLARATSEVWSSTQTTASVREHAAHFGPNDQLFGVVTHAARERASSSKPTLLFLVGGVNHHVGQNRMYTRWARRWAVDGYASLRFDLAGFGDSGEAHGGGDGKLHCPESVGDVRVAMDYMGQLCGSRSFAIIGLCSGALLGFHAALEDARIVSLGLLNWTRFMLDPSTLASAAGRGVRDIGNTAEHRRYQSLRYYIQKAAAADVWRRVMKGEVDARGIARHLIRRTTERVRAELVHRLGGEDAAETEFARDFRRLAARNVASCVVYNGDEPILDVFREKLGPHLGRLIQSRNVRLELIDGTDHVFTPLWSQETVFELMSKHVVGVDGRV